MEQWADLIYINGWKIETVALFLASIFIQFYRACPHLSFANLSPCEYIDFRCTNLKLANSSHFLFIAVNILKRTSFQQG